MEREQLRSVLPHRAGTRGQRSDVRTSPYPLSLSSTGRHVPHNDQGRSNTNNMPGRGFVTLPPYQWKSSPSAAPQISVRKRQRDEQDQPTVKRQRVDLPTRSTGFPVVDQTASFSRHADPVIGESSGSLNNSFVNSHASSPFHFHPPSPVAPCNPDTCVELSDQMVKLFEACQQQTSDLEQKESCRFQLQQDIRQVFAGQLYLTGSSMNGLGCRSSDADLCLVLKSINRINAIYVLSRLQALFRSLPYVERAQLIRAKVPILKFRRKSSGLEFDLNVNNTVGIRNTFLLRSYAYADQRIRPLVLVIKKWARHNQINDASKGTLSSYALVLMTIHFLQTLKDPVLPSLQRDFPDCFDPLLNLDEVPDRPKRIPPFLSRNQSSLGELFLGFLGYYATQFRWEREVISVREARALPRTNSHEWRNKYICIEEPFERNNVARAVYDQTKFDTIKAQFVESFRILRGHMNLNSILPVRETINHESRHR